LAAFKTLLFKLSEAYRFDWSQENVEIADKPMCVPAFRLYLDPSACIRRRSSSGRRDELTANTKAR